MGDRPLDGPLRRVLRRLPAGTDGRPLRARHRMALAAVLLGVFLLAVGPALDAVTAPSSSRSPSSSSFPSPVALDRVAPVAHAVPAAQPVPALPLPAVPAPDGPTAPAAPTLDNGTGISVRVGDGSGDRNQVISIIVLMTVLSVAPSLLLLTTSFAKIAVVLSLTRNALGTPTIPPNQVLTGLALFLSLFIMGPVIGQVYEQGVQPWSKGEIQFDQAIERGGEPLKLFMTKHTGDAELQTMIKLSKSEQPQNKADTDFKTLIPAFIISELKAAFIIGFIIFIPFLVIDLVVSSVLMSMGMMMLPPIMISLPFKLLLFVMVDGWTLITTALVSSYG